MKGASNFAGDIQIWHVQLKAGQPSERTFKLPYAEVLVAKIKDNVTDERFQDGLFRAFERHHKECGMPFKFEDDAPLHGRALEDPRTVIIVLGWKDTAVSSLPTYPL